MRVNLSATELSSLLPTPEPSVKGAGTGGASFAALHAESLGKLASVSTPASSTAGAATAAIEETAAKRTDTKPAAPKNETYKAVEGQPYEEIVSGRRNGMFINRSGNERDGEAFVLVKRNGREFHVYGSGADRQVVPIAKRDAPPTTSVTGGEQVVKGTTYRDVPGRAFDEIVSGPRNGMFVNRSGNSRDGKAFVLVKRDDHELHIYGKGADRLVVRVVPPELRKDETAQTPKIETEPPATNAPVAGTPSSGSNVLLT
jgi:hypothetical protein